MNYPAYSHQNPNDRLDHIVFLNFGMMATAGFPAVKDVYAVFQKVAELLDGTGVLVTVKPPLTKRPGEYTTVQIVPDDKIGWSPERSAGTCPVKACFNVSWWVPNVTYASWHPSWENDFVGGLAAHEAVHMIQGDRVSHEEDPVRGRPNLMSWLGYKTGAALSEFMTKKVREAVAEFNAGWRFADGKGKVNIGPKTK